MQSSSNYSFAHQINVKVISALKVLTFIKNAMSVFYHSDFVSFIFT